MTYESGPINKGKYWRTKFDDLKAYEITRYNNGYENYYDTEYYLARRFSDEDENDEGLTFIGKDYVVQVTDLDSRKVTFFAEYMWMRKARRALSRGMKHIMLML
jgi:hypothetical protein